MKEISILTIMLFLLTSCSYNGTIYKAKENASMETTSSLYRYNTVACIMGSPNEKQLIIDSGINDTVIDLDFPEYIQDNLKELFVKTLVVKTEQKSLPCSHYIYPKQELTCYNNKMLYNSGIKVYDAKTNKEIFSHKNTESGDCEKSKGALMFFSTLLFPPVLGGLFYGLNASGKAKDNFVTANKLITQGIRSNIAAFEKVDIVALSATQ
jgi:hypothetical protein